MKNFIIKNKFHIICISIIVLFFAVVVPFTFYVFPRFLFSMKVLGQSFWFYFLRIFHIDDNCGLPSNFYSTIKSDDSLRNIFYGSVEFKLFPSDNNVFVLWLESMCLCWINLDYFKSSFSILTFMLKNLNIFVLLFLMFYILIVMFNVIYFENKNPVIRGFSRNYKNYEKFDSAFNYKIRCFFKDFYQFLKVHSYYYKIFIFEILFMLNVVNAVIELFSGFLVFVCSFNFASLYENLFSFVYSIYPLFVYIPLIIWVALLLVLFQFLRKHIAINRLSHMEHKNEEFISRTGVITLVSGAPGSSKTTLITDMSLTCEKLFRYKLKDICNKYRDFFPMFDWCSFEKFVIDSSFVNRYAIKNYFRDFQNKFEESHGKNFDLFGYDYMKYDLVHYDGLQVYSIFDCLEIYAESYFLYQSYNPLNVSNYAIRHDYNKKSSDYFPNYVYDFFTNQLDEYFELSKTSHIIDFDSMRLGKRFGLPKTHLDGCVVSITEIDKERGNQFDRAGLQKDSDSVNILNDYFNEFNKLGRHPCTIDHFPFFKVIADLQRLKSLNADLVGISESLYYIKSDKKDKFVFPFYIFDLIICDFFISVRAKFIDKFRSTRNQYSLLYRFMNLLGLPFVRYKEKLINNYFFSMLSLESCTSSMNEENKIITESNYYLMKKKIHSNRFATDCYYEIFGGYYENDTISQDSSPCYVDIYPSSDELKSQNSMFSEKLFKIKENSENQNDR